VFALKLYALMTEFYHSFTLDKEVSEVASVSATCALFSLVADLEQITLSALMLNLLLSDVIMHYFYWLLM
jgi:hypothetical protein